MSKKHFHNHSFRDIIFIKVNFGIIYITHLIRVKVLKIQLNSPRFDNIYFIFIVLKISARMKMVEQSFLDEKVRLMHPSCKVNRNILEL